MKNFKKKLYEKYNNNARVIIIIHLIRLFNAFLIIYINNI